MRLRLSSSAQTFFSPARWETASCTECLCAQSATSFRKDASGSVVLKSLFMPLSAAVLSLAVGNIKDMQDGRAFNQAVCRSASCARTSKQAMYGCAESVRAGQVARTSCMVHV